MGEFTRTTTLCIDEIETSFKKIKSRIGRSIRKVLKDSKFVNFFRVWAWIHLVLTRKILPTLRAVDMKNFLRLCCHWQAKKGLYTWAKMIWFVIKNVWRKGRSWTSLPSPKALAHPTLQHISLKNNIITIPTQSLLVWFFILILYFLSCKWFSEKSDMILKRFKENKRDTDFLGSERQSLKRRLEEAK